MILKAIEGQVEGTAKAFGDSAPGKMMKFKAALGDIGERLGAVFLPVLDAPMPTILKLADTLAGALEPVLGAVVDLFGALQPILEPVLGIVGSLAHLLGDVLAPALRMLEPLLRATADLLKPIGDAIGKLTEIPGMTGLLGLFAKYGPRDSAVGSNFTSGDFKVNVRVNPEDSARRVAEKMSPAIARGVRGAQRRIDQAAWRRQVAERFERDMVLR